MYKRIVEHKTRAGYALLNRGRFAELVQQFDPHVRFTFAGDHALAVHASGRDEALAWFERVGRLMPGLTLTPSVIVVQGPPWDTRVATRFTVEATLDGGQRYANAGMQLIRLRWGKVVEDHLHEDTQAVAHALEHLSARGHAEASELPDNRLDSGGARDVGGHAENGVVAAEAE